MADRNALLLILLSAAVIASGCTSTNTQSNDSPDTAPVNCSNIDLEIEWAGQEGDTVTVSVRNIGTRDIENLTAYVQVGSTTVEENLAKISAGQVGNFEIDISNTNGTPKEVEVRSLRCPEVRDSKTLN